MRISGSLAGPRRDTEHSSGRACGRACPDDRGGRAPGRTTDPRPTQVHGTPNLRTPGERLSRAHPGVRPRDSSCTGRLPNDEARGTNRTGPKAARCERRHLRRDSRRSVAGPPPDPNGSRGAASRFHREASRSRGWPRRHRGTGRRRLPTGTRCRRLPLRHGSPCREGTTGRATGGGRPSAPVMALSTPYRGQRSRRWL